MSEDKTVGVSKEELAESYRKFSIEVARIHYELYGVKLPEKIDKGV